MGSNLELYQALIRLCYSGGGDTGYFKRQSRPKLFIKNQLRKNGIRISVPHLGRAPNKLFTKFGNAPNRHRLVAWRLNVGL